MAQRDLLIQTELSLLGARVRTLQITWLPVRSDVHVGSHILLDEDERWWVVERQFTTLPRELVLRQREWNAGGVTSRR